MMRTVLYIRGCPGTGKHTIAKELERLLGWSLFWIHDLDGICRIVGDHRIPRLMDEVTKPVLKHLMTQRKNIIYVRPSRDELTVESVREAVLTHGGYRLLMVRLVADYETMLERVKSRDKSEFRISTREGLDEYLRRSPTYPNYEDVVDTSGTIDEAIDQIMPLLIGDEERLAEWGTHANR